VRNPRLSTTGLALARLGTILTALILAFVLVYGVSVRTVTGRELADLSLRGAIAARPLFSGTVQTVLNVVSIASLLGAVAVVAVIALLRLARLEGLVAIGIIVAANASTWLLKEVLLPRPDLGLDEATPATLNSLPSGHSTAVFSAVAALAFVVPSRARPSVVLVGAGIASVNGLATMLAGWHRAGDSMAAFLVVGFWTTVAAGVVVVLGDRRGPPPAPASAGWPRVMLWPAVFAVVAVILGGTVAVGLDAAPVLRTSTAGSGVALLAAAVLVSGTASGAAVGILGSLLLMDAAPGMRAGRR